MMSLRMQFEKRDVGYCRKLSGMRGSALLAERERFKLYTIRGHSLMTSHTKVRVVGSFEMVYVQVGLNCMTKGREGSENRNTCNGWD